MEVTFHTIKQITVGAVELWEEADGLHFSKCTREQNAAWRERSETLFNNALATTGVRLDFYTNSNFVKITLAAKGKYEVKLNGVLYRQYLVNNVPQDGVITLNFENNEEKHILFSLPSLDYAGVISSMEIADGAYVKPHTFDRKILFVGDSITQGYNSVYDTSSYAYQVSEYLNADSVIQGIGGAVFAPKTVLPTGYQPDIVFIAFGTNDFVCLQTLEELEQNAREYIQKIQAIYVEAKLFVISPIWRMDEKQVRAMGSFQECCNRIKALAKELDVNAIDGERLVPKLADFMADTVHPNDLGFSVYALNLLKRLKGKI